MTEKLRVCLCAVAALSAGILAVGCNRSPQAKEAQYLKRGIALIAKKDYGRAALEFRNAIKAMPKDAEPYYQLGLAYLDRKSTRLNSSHLGISYAVFGLKKKKQKNTTQPDARRGGQGSRGVCVARRT